MHRVARRPITGTELASPALVAAATPIKTGNSTKKVADNSGWKKKPGTSTTPSANCPTSLRRPRRAHRAARHRASQGGHD